MVSKPLRVCNIFAGPGTGKSTTASALFAELKYQGHNTELIPEYAKDATWEKRGEKVFRAQEYLFGKQHFRLSRVADEVDFVITDSPVLQCIAYCEPDFYMPSLLKTIREAHDRYESIDVLLVRSDEKAYNPKGRNQTEKEARRKDGHIRKLLDDQGITYYTLPFHRVNVWDIIEIMYDRGWLTDLAKIATGAHRAATAANQAFNRFDLRLAGQSAPA